MSEYGIKIKNIEAASIYEYQNGFRDKLHSRDAMLVNSLFLDFLLENGLNVYKGTSTRDVICLQFSYKTKWYAEMKKLVEYQLDKTTDERISSILNERKKIIEQNKEFCIEISKNDLRVKYYTEGVEITYKTFTKNDKREIESKRETIKYRMLYRTPGKAKKGTCMFIREELYDVARNFLYMGIQLPKKNPPIVEIGAYSSLITSSIVGKIQIKPEEILVIPDVDSFMTTKVISVETDENKNCIAVERDNYKLKNTMFDGQALIESSICPEWSDGYLLLRHHMFKAAAFKTHIQNFMKERFGVNYENATVKDIWGRDVKVSNIKLITTENALKWMKFDITFDYWSGWVRKNDCMFGIVKTAHESKLGQVQRMSYQMVNALDLDTMSKVVECSMKYIEDLKNNDEVFLSYLKKNINFSNDFDVLIALCEHNSDFVKSSYFKERRKAIIQTYTLNFKSGRIIQDADNLVIVGSPYAMLLHSVGEDPFSDPTFNKEEGAIQCWTNRFNDGEYLASFRSPFNSKNNMGYLHNSHHEYFDKYFNFGKQIIAVNMNGTDFQDRNNGSDQDSDSIYTTNQPDIVACAKSCCENYLTIVNNISQSKNIYDLSMENYALIDNNLASAQKAIGQSSNLAQLALTYTYNFNDKKFDDYVCILSVVAQIAIDNAKRSYDIDLTNEIARIKSDMEIKNNKYPAFWELIRKDFNSNAKDKAKNEKQVIETELVIENPDIDYQELKMQADLAAKEVFDAKTKINTELICPMNYICNIKIKRAKRSETIPMDKFFIKHPLKIEKRKCKKVEELIQKYSLLLYSEYQSNSDDETDKEQYLLLRSDFEQLISDIHALNLSKNYLDLMSWLIDRAFIITSSQKRNKDSIKNNTANNKVILLKALYSTNPKTFLQCFVEGKNQA